MAKISIVPWIAKKLKRCIGIVEDTDTASQAIASDKYVIWKGDVCKSTSAISEGDTLSYSNLSAVNDGVGNDLSQAIANKIPGKIVVLTGTTAANGSDLNVNYPTGASYSNTIVLSAQIEAAGAWRIIGLSTPASDYMLNIRLVSTYIKVETAAANSANKPLKLILFITE